MKPNVITTRLAGCLTAGHLFLSMGLAEAEEPLPLVNQEGVEVITGSGSAGALAKMLLQVLFVGLEPTAVVIEDFEVHEVYPCGAFEDQVEFEVWFSAPATSFDSLDDLVITTTGDVTFSGVNFEQISDFDWFVTLEGVSGSGSIRLAVSTESDVTSAGGDPLVASHTSNPVAVGPVVSEPFFGTIFMDPDIITEEDETTFVDMTFIGRDLRTSFDRRVNDWVENNVFLFEATFSDGFVMEVQVNPEFGDEATARAEAMKFLPAIGRLPSGLKTDVHEIWLHRGLELFGGRNNSILIHSDIGQTYIWDGLLEEALVHEAAHTSLDAAHLTSEGWLAAQAADGAFISTYAKDNTEFEDVAESYLAYLAVRIKRDRISPGDALVIERTIPNRIAYFESISVPLGPVVYESVLRLTYLAASAEYETMQARWDSAPGKRYMIEISEDLSNNWSVLVPSVDSGGESTTHLYRGPLPSDKAFFRVRELE